MGVGFKIMFGVFWGIVFWISGSVAMAQTKTACDYITQDDINSVLGSGNEKYDKMVSDSTVCSYMSPNSKEGVNVLLVGTGMSAEMGKMVQLQRGKPLKSLGDIAVEQISAGGDVIVRIFKNGTAITVTSSANIEQKQAKAEALAKLCADKM